MAMNRESYELMKAKGREKLKEQTMPAAFNQSELLQQMKESIDILLAQSEKQLAAQNSILKWVRFFGYLAVSNLLVVIISAIFALLWQSI